MKLKAKIKKTGNGYHVMIPPALIRCGVLDVEKTYNFIVLEK